MQYCLLTFSSICWGLFSLFSSLPLVYILQLLHLCLPFHKGLPTPTPCKVSSSKLTLHCIAKHLPPLLFPILLSSVYTASSLTSWYCQLWWQQQQFLRNVFSGLAKINEEKDNIIKMKGAGGKNEGGRSKEWWSSLSLLVCGSWQFPGLLKSSIDWCQFLVQLGKRTSEVIQINLWNNDGETVGLMKVFPQEPWNITKISCLKLACMTCISHGREGQDDPKNWRKTFELRRTLRSSLMKGLSISEGETNNGRRTWNKTWQNLVIFTLCVYVH